METESRKQNLDRSAVHLFGDSGMTILPWTKQILFVLWEQLRFLVHLIYYSFMSVFQMFRLEVHLRISEETGPHIQHMNTPGNPAEGFFLSSLFDNNKSVIVSGSSSLSKLSSDLAGTHPGSLLSSLVSDELCCSLVDDFVARAAEGFSDTEDLTIGQHASWKLGCPGEWNVFVGSDHSSGSNSSSSDLFYRSTHTDKVFSWENDVSGRSETSCDPYTPLSFSASIFSYSPRESAEPAETTSSWEFRVESSTSAEDNHAPFCPAFGGRSDSESSWGSSDCSSADGDREESEKLWDLFSCSSDPYHPLHFTASASSSKPAKKDASVAPSVAPRPPSVIEPPTELPPSPTDTESIGPSSLSEEDEEETLWQSLCHNDDPYHPLHFRACIRSSSADAKANRSASDAASQNPVHACSGSSSMSPDSSWEFSPSAFQTRRKSKKPRLLGKRRAKGHCCTTSPDKLVFVPWRRKVKGEIVEEHEEGQPAVKKVQFSPRVQVHKMRAWSFALQASRKGHWEELARDRDRFRRRIQDTEHAIGYCLSQAHRETILDGQESMEGKHHGSKQNLTQSVFLS
ncbi:protein phosphatase 1 regulatory subunit 15B [Sardina pilchardus]|uniref:protein phosphatase 1 regulatory subunit 15B n=1 Tax=Sardina pilchardus TaxID=27697 RepID=UPI002E1325CA